MAVMSPRLALSPLLLGFLALGCGAAPGARHAPAPRPGFARDVVVVSIDTLRADATGFMGNRRVATPHLDRLASASIVFERARAHNVMTLPSHVNLLTGRLPYEHGVRDNAGFSLGPELPTMASLLRDAGFATAGFVGAFPLDERFGLARGFDTWDDRYPEGTTTAFAMAERRGDQVVAAALDFWRRHAGRRRFLFVHLYDPHAPYAAAEPFAAQYRDQPYLGEVAAVDSYLGPLLDAVGANDPGGAASGALVVITSDHGEAQGDHGETSHGLFANEATLRVPLVLHAAALAPARRHDAVAHIDVLPTVLEAAGVPAPAGLPGRSLLRAAPAGRAIYFEALRAHLTRGWAPLRGGVREERKFISLPVPELYHLAADPAEQNNLAGARANESAELDRLLGSESAWPPQRAALASADELALRRLGYLTGGGPAPRKTYGPWSDPKNLVVVDRQLHRFVELYQQRELAAATELAREVLAAHPEMGLAHYYLAQVLLERGEVTAALAAMEEARRRGAADAALLRQLALTLAELGRPAEGAAVLTPVADARDPDTLAVLGLVQAEAGALDQARTSLERVFALDPHHPLAHQHLALVALYRKDWPECEAQARAALARNESLPLAWNYLGLALYNLARAEEAVAAWETAVSLAPDDFDLVYNLGTVAAELGRLDTARRALSHFIAHAPAARYRRDQERARVRLRQLGG